MNSKFNNQHWVHVWVKPVNIARYIGLSTNYDACEGGNSENGKHIPHTLKRMPSGVKVSSKQLKLLPLLIGTIANNLQVDSTNSTPKLGPLIITIGTPE